MLRRRSNDLGLHRLKDMDRPEGIFELRHPGLPIVTAPLVGPSTGGVHLPEQLTTFVGRAAETAAVADLLTTARVVTLTGVGGTGKTRLAIESARIQADGFRDGVWMTDLAPVTEPDLVLQQLAGTWNLRPGEGAPLAQIVSTYLATKELLLVVDNCEHVLVEASTSIGALLASGPGVSVLATSREPLGLHGEAVYQVPALGLPPDDEAAAASDAVALFLDRCRAVRPGYEPTPADMTAIISVCRRLDGIPLGLELAAARLSQPQPH